MNSRGYGFLPFLCAWASLASATSLCAKGDRILFSCPLAKSDKIVSMCAAGTAGPHRRFYYAFGRPGAVEFAYSPKSHASNPFMRTRLVYAGPTGGVSYSFVHAGYKYVVYSISGTQLARGGVLVQRLGQPRASVDIACEPRSITGADKDAAADAQEWKDDPDIGTHGLPYGSLE